MSESAQALKDPFELPEDLDDKITELNTFRNQEDPYSIANFGRSIPVADNENSAAKPELESRTDFDIYPADLDRFLNDSLKFRPIPPTTQLLCLDLVTAIIEYTGTFSQPSSDNVTSLAIVPNKEAQKRLVYNEVINRAQMLAEYFKKQKIVPYFESISDLIKSFNPGQIKEMLPYLDPNGSLFSLLPKRIHRQASLTQPGDTKQLSASQEINLSDLRVYELAVVYLAYVEYLVFHQRATEGKNSNTMISKDPTTSESLVTLAHPNSMANNKEKIQKLMSTLHEKAQQKDQLLNKLWAQFTPIPLEEVNSKKTDYTERIAVLKEFHTFLKDLIHMYSEVVRSGKIAMTDDRVLIKSYRALADHFDPDGKYFQFGNKLPTPAFNQDNTINLRILADLSSCIELANDMANS